MKARLLALVSVISCLLICTGALSASADSLPDGVAQAQEIRDRILAFEANGSSTQEWLDTTLAEQAGTGAEWYVLCLAQSGDYDFSAYEQALIAYLDANSIPSATTRQKYALLLAAVGSTDAYISATADSTAGALGVMSYAYGLHLAHNGYSVSLSTDQIMQEILALQNRDGGWAISGTVSDADVSAMVLQALAPHYEQNAALSDAVDRALAMLSAQQTDAGGYLSYGVENPESAAQVAIALCALGIDPCTDARFIKNGNTLFDAMDAFALPTGGYAHAKGGAYSASATAQVLCAATAYLRFADGSSPLYTLDGARPDEVQTAPESNTAPDTVPDTPPRAPEKPLSYKPFACGAVVLLGMIGCAVLIACKKRHYKNFIAMGVAVAVLIAAILLIDIRTPGDYYGSESATKQNPIGTVTLTVRCDAVPNLSDYDYLPSDGILLATEVWEIEAGETVYDILVQAARKHSLHLDATGAGEAMYVRGIGHVYEQEHGDLSGWNYRVNGSTPSMGCAAYVLSDGDEIVWEYSLTVGQ